MIGYRRGILQEGRFAGAGRSGLSLSDGYFWTRRAGGYNFYLSRQGLTEIDFDHPIAACGPVAEPIDIGGVFSAQHDHWVAVRTVGRFGLESERCAWLRVRTDQALSGKAVPDQVQHLRAGLTRQGNIQLQWDYEPRMGVVPPAVFNIYGGLDYEPIFYDWPEAQTPYRESQKHYVWTSTMTFSQTIRLAVRAVSAEGIHDGSQRMVVARGDPRGSPVVQDLKVETF